MKKIEKEETIKRSVIKWVAKDDTEFDTAQECESYERSAECAIKSLYNSYVIGHTDEWELFRGDSDRAIDILKVDNAAVPIILKQIAFIQCKNTLDPTTVEIVKESVGNILFVGWNYDKDWCYVIGSQKSLINGINNTVEKYGKETIPEGKDS